MKKPKVLNNKENKYLRNFSSRFLKKKSSKDIVRKDWRYRITQFVCVLLITSFMVNTTPASTPTIIASAGEFGQDVRYGILSSNWSSKLLNWSSGLLFFLNTSAKKKKQLNKLVILPGNVKVHQGETINFSAIGYGADDEVINGLSATWTVQNADKKANSRTLQGGNFLADFPGDFIISAESEGVRSEVTVTVFESKSSMLLRKLKATESQGDQEKTQQIASLGEYSNTSISSKNIYSAGLAEQDENPNVEANTDRKRGGPNASEIEASPEATAQAPRMMLRPPDEQGWGNGNWWTADDPGNQTGNPTGTSNESAAGNGNFQISAPIIALAGRSLDVNLSLNYNSRLWSKSGNTMSYDSDRGFPAPGWSFGFGKMMFMGTQGGCMLVDADGTRHGYTGSISNYSYGGYTSSVFSGHTADGTLIDYNCAYSSSSYGTSVSGSVTLPNGTVISYNSSLANGQQAFPTQILDVHGNYINITYRNNRGPEIQTVTDTMGRVVTFNYDSLNRLISVTAPKMDNAGTRTVVRIHYKQITLSPGFAYPLTMDTANWYPYVIDSIYYPGTQTGYWFNDSDSYSNYGMISKVLEQRAMSWSGSAGDQGTVTAGQTSRQAVYNYPATANYTLTDAPTFTTLTENWAGMDTAPIVTSYSVNNNATPRTVTVTQPNGAKNKQTSYNAPGQWNDGLVYQDETFDASNNLISKSVVTWGQGSYDSPRPTRTEVTDEKGQVLTTDLVYGSVYNQVVTRKEYEYNSTTAIQKQTQISYENNSVYTNRHIFNLVKSSEVYDSANVRVSRTDYEYDNNIIVTGVQNHNLKATPNVIMHSNYHNPYTTETYETCTAWYYNYPECNDGVTYAYVGPYPQYEVYCPSERVCTEWTPFSVYNPGTAYRGNVTKVTNYTYAPGLGGAISETNQYDVTGNLVTSSRTANEISKHDFDISTQYAYPTSQSEGDSAPNSTVRNTISTVYDFNTGLVKQTTDKNGRTRSITYNADTLRPTVSTSSTGAYEQLTYDDSAMTVTEEVRDAGSNVAGKAKKFLNGIGKVVKEESYGPNSTVDIVETKYTVLGQLWKQTRPYRTGDTPQWTENVYDIQGRVTQVIEADGSVAQAFFNETARPSSASTLPGNTVRVVDAWGRERWERYDKNQLLAEVVEPDPNGNGSVMAAGNIPTKYTYDVMGRLTQTEQGAQVRKFLYNSIGQIIRQKLAEQTATINDNGVYVGAGHPDAKWSSGFWYDQQGNMSMKVDARGVKTHYYYHVNGVFDPLNRLQSRFYDLSGPLDPNVTIHMSPVISYEYETTGDKNRVKKIRTHGFLTEDFTYDTEGRVSDYSQTVDYRQSYPMVMSYIYDSLDRVAETRQPAQYGMTGNPRKIIQSSYDSTSRLTTLTVNGQQHLGNIVYDASDRATSLKVGTAGTNQVTENYTYNPQTGLLTNQTAIRNNQALLDLSYDYQRNGSNGTLNGKTGQLTKITNNLNSAKSRDYKYDAVGRLITAKGGTNLWQQNYAYDRYGNRTSVTSSGVSADGSVIPNDGIASALTYDSTSNRITTSNSNGQFEYDSAGNLTRSLAENGTTWLRYEYDTANRIQAVKNDSGGLIEAFQYGSTNARLMRFNYKANEFTLYASEGGKAIAEYTEYTSTVPVWTKGYVYSGEQILSTSTPNAQGTENVEFNHPDQLGTRIVTNQQSGNWFEQVSLPFGTALSAESSGNTATRFTSYDRSNATGLDYAINRTYDSKQGRFTQVDPIGMSAVDFLNPQTLNLFAYCANDPINHTDADGLFFGFLKKLFSWIGKILKFVAVAVAIVMAVVTIIYAPYLFGSVIKAVFGIISAVAGAASKVFELLGLKTLANVFSIIAAVADFGSSLFTDAGKLIKGTKAILGAIKAAANMVSTILSATGHAFAAQIVGLGSSILGFIDGHIQEVKDANGKTVLGTNGLPKLEWKKPTAWEWWKFARQTAQSLATLVGAKKFAMYLDFLGLPEDVEARMSAMKELFETIPDKEYDKLTYKYGKLVKDIPDRAERVEMTRRAFKAWDIFNGVQRAKKIVGAYTKINNANANFYRRLSIVFK